MQGRVGTKARATGQECRRNEAKSSVVLYWSETARSAVYGADFLAHSTRLFYPFNRISHSSASARRDAAPRCLTRDTDTTTCDESPPVALTAVGAFTVDVALGGFPLDPRVPTQPAMRSLGHDSSHSPECSAPNQPVQRKCPVSPSTNCGVGHWIQTLTPRSRRMQSCER